jgi:tetratricopeptide (TPR) repeat protein
MTRRAPAEARSVTGGRGRLTRGIFGVGGLIAALIAAAPLGCAAQTVVRVIDGREIEGPFISEYAYTLYAIGADAEAHGDLATALQAYEAAAEEDPDSPQTWTRIGAIRCRLDPDDPGAAFERARALDPDFEPLEREQAQCAIERGEMAKAVEHARRSFELDPDNEAPVLLYASVLARVGRSKEAVLLLQELTIRRPWSMRALWELRSYTIMTKDQAATADASRRLAQLRNPGRATDVQADITLGAGAARLEGGEAALLEALDAALAEGNLKLARKLGRQVRLVPAEIAVRAAALGKSVLAREQAELVLGADPSDNGARIALVVAADLARDTALLGRSLAELPPVSAGSQPSLLARLLFAEVLYRKVGADAARAWLGLPDGPVHDQEPFRGHLKANGAADPLLSVVLRRVAESLSAGPQASSPKAPGKPSPPAKPGP